MGWDDFDALIRSGKVPEIYRDEVVGFRSHSALQEAVIWFVGAGMEGCGRVYSLAVLGDEGEQSGGPFGGKNPGVFQAQL